MATATLTWTPPSTRTDGSALTPDMIAFTEIYDQGATDPSQPIGTVQGAAGSYTTDVLAVGNHSFWVIVQDTGGHRSAQSNQAIVIVPPVVANPSAVADLAAALNA